MFFPAQFDQTELGRRSYCATKRTAHSMVRTSSKGTQTKGTDMTGNTTARTQAIELAERLREVAAWNVRLHLAKEGLEQQTLCEAAGVTKATISARMNLDAAWDLNAIAAAAVTLGMPPAELLDDTLYDIVNSDDTNTNEGKGASLVAAMTSTLLARHIAGRCDPLKTKGSCRITMMATGANRYPQRGGYERQLPQEQTANPSNVYLLIINLNFRYSNDSRLLPVDTRAVLLLSVIFMRLMAETTCDE